MDPNAAHALGVAMIVFTGCVGIFGLVSVLVWFARNRIAARRMLRGHECRTPRLTGLFFRPLASPGDRWRCDGCDALYEVYEPEFIRWEFSDQPVLEWKVVDEHQEIVDARQRELDAWQDEFDTIEAATIRGTLRGKLRAVRSWVA